MGKPAAGKGEGPPDGWASKAEEGEAALTGAAGGGDGGDGDGRGESAVAIACALPAAI